MEKAIVFISDKKFQKGFLVSLYSLISNNSINLPIILLTDYDPSPKFSSYIKNIYSHIHIKNIETEKYKTIKSNTNYPQYKKAYYKFEVFSLEKYDYILYLDTDLLILNNIDFLLNDITKYQFSAVQDRYNQYNKNYLDFNTGVIGIGKKYLDKSITNHLIEQAKPGNFPHGDQEVINNMIELNYYKLPIWYNLFKDYFRFMGSWVNKTKILHYISKKPWEKYDPKIHAPGNLEVKNIENMWHKYHNNMIKKYGEFNE